MLPFPGGGRGFDVPRDLLPEGAAPGDVFEVRFEAVEAETERMADENRRLLDEMLGRGEK